MKSLRILQQTERARIEHDLVLTRVGELHLRSDNLLTKGLLFPLTSIDAAISGGLISSPGAGLSVDLTAPAFAIQAISDGSLTKDVKYVADPNGGTDYNVTITAAHISLDRIDIIEARIVRRSEFTDLSVSVADPVTQVISAETRDRDFEYYLELQSVDGTPAASPTPPSPTVATAGVCTGSVDINTVTTDLSSEYILSFAIGLDTEFVEVDLRGAVPAATTGVEILAAINAVGFGTIATLNGNFLEITAPGAGENSVVKIKQPLDASTDAYENVLGYPESPGYYDVYQGENAFFKVAEIFIPAAAVSLTAGNIRSREEKDIEWDSDAATIENILSYDNHRKSNPIDHADGSIFVQHLNATVLDVLQGKVTLFRGTNAPVYPVTGDSTYRQGTVLLHDVAVRKANGDVQDDFLDSEQEFPVNRVDQREEDFSSGSGYSVPVSLSEAASDKRAFTVGAAVNDGTNDYTVQDFAGNHTRVGIYITNGGSVTGFTDLRITLHDTGDVQEAQEDIPIADLVSVGTGWIYIDMAATLTVSVTYHYHFEMVGETSPTPPVLGNQSGTGADTAAFREMYLSTGAKYGTVDEDDLIFLLDDAGARLIPIRSTGDDDIVSPGDGFLGASDGSNYDIIPVDFSNVTFWENWRYEDYIGIDVDLGRVKIPPSLDVRDLFAEFNITEGNDEQDTKNQLMHEDEQSLEDNLTDLNDDFRGIEADFSIDSPSGAYEAFLGESLVVGMPNTGSPFGRFQFRVRKPGRAHKRPVFFHIDYAMAGSNAGLFQLEMEIYVQGVLVATRTQLIDPPNDTSRATILTSDLFIDDKSEFVEGNDIVIVLRRDNSIGSNHTQDLQLINILII